MKHMTDEVSNNPAITNWNLIVWFCGFYKVENFFYVLLLFKTSKINKKFISIMQSGSNKYTCWLMLIECIYY